MLSSKRIVWFVGFLCVVTSGHFLPTRAQEKSLTGPTDSVGYGWSVSDDTTTVKPAVEKAVSMLKQTVKAPDFVFIFATVGYDPKALVEEVRSQLGKKTKIYGGSSCLGVMTPDGFHVGKLASLAILGIKSDKVQFGVGSADMGKEETPRHAGKKAIISAIKNAGKTISRKPTVVFITAAPGNEEEILKGITEIVGNEVPVIGGSSGDNDITGKWYQVANDKVYSNGIALTVVYTADKIKIGWSYEAGYLRTSWEGKITKSDRRTIYQIDGKPAAEVYNKWLGGALDDMINTGGSVLHRTTFHPLAKIISGKGGETYYLSIHPLSINLPEKSLTVFANVNTGENISLLSGNWELLLNRAYSTPTIACRQGNIAKDEGLFAVYTFCAGTMLAIPPEEMPKMPLLIKDVIGGTPFIGTYTFGEQGFLPGVGNTHGNLVSSMVIFSR